MGNIKPVLPVKLVVGILSAHDASFCLAEKQLIRFFGKIDYRTGPMDFNFTDYYTNEMGHGLRRFFLSFKRLIQPGQLAGIKVITNKLERRLAKKALVLKRTVNIDPGYITDAKLVLASTKDYSHRIYLSSGIYAETTLSYQKHSFRPRTWTYPDYACSEYVSVFNHIRDIFMSQRPGQSA
ncbi:MAG: DUF4416 family protein [Candidatus Omnitrophica bacterium]|jgi:hypothetical protein|nr:DUF4416 family protein [Candidatus Omnitrophota bacterium]